MRPGRLDDWFVRPNGTCGIPDRCGTSMIDADTDLLIGDNYADLLVFDTNTLFDNTDLCRTRTTLGGRYMAHLPPVVSWEIDDANEPVETRISATPHNEPTGT
jgi:hypothetical protein